MSVQADSEPARRRSNAGRAALGERGPDDIQMNPAATGASHGPVSAPARPGMMRRTASEALQSGQVESAASPAGSVRGGRFGRLPPVALTDRQPRHEAIDMGFRIRIAASGSDHAKPTSSVGNDRPSMTTGVRSGPVQSWRAIAPSLPRTSEFESRHRSWRVPRVVPWQRNRSTAGRDRCERASLSDDLRDGRGEPIFAE